MVLVFRGQHHGFYDADCPECRTRSAFVIGVSFERLRPDAASRRHRRARRDRGARLVAVALELPPAVLIRALWIRRIGCRLRARTSRSASAREYRSSRAGRVADRLPTTALESMCSVRPGIVPADVLPRAGKFDRLAECPGSLPSAPAVALVICGAFGVERGTAVSSGAAMASGSGVWAEALKN